MPLIQSAFLTLRTFRCSLAINRYKTRVGVAAGEEQRGYEMG